MLGPLKRLLRESSRSDVVLECRRCGASLSAPSETCPECESGDVVRYEI